MLIAETCIKHPKEGNQMNAKKTGLHWCLLPIVISLCPCLSHATPPFTRAMIVVFENTNYQEALSQPFFSQVAQSGATFTHFLAESHPSQPNYIAMIAGDTFGVTNDSPVNLEATNVGDLLEQSGKSWKVYAEDYPGNCFQGTTSGKYARKHVPFISFKSVQSDPQKCANIVNATQLDQDVRTQGLPDFSMYIPNLNNDGHDTNAAFANNWLSQTFGPRLNDPSFMNGLLLVITFDESENLFGPNQIFTAFYGTGVKAGSVVSSQNSHYSVLRTIEDALGIGNLGRNDATAQAIEGIWN